MIQRFLNKILIICLTLTLSGCVIFPFSAIEDEFNGGGDGEDSECASPCRQDTYSDNRCGCSPCAQYNPEREFVNYAKSRNSIYFDSKSDAVQGESIEKVNHMVYELSKVDDVKVLLYGYTDRMGSTKYNDALSKRRTGAVKKALINSGVIKENNIIIEATGYGEFDPSISHSAAANHAPSRRVDMYIVNNYNHSQC